MATGNRVRWRNILIVTLTAGVFVAGGWLAVRALRPTPGPPAPAEVAITPGQPAPLPATSTAPARRGPAPKDIILPTKVEKSYVDAKGRIINPNDSDGDALPDAWEMKRYGTIKYDARTLQDAERIDIAPPRADPADTDGDGLPDAWEKKHFGDLAAGPRDDPDEDGFDNLAESRLGQLPNDADLLDPARKPTVLIHPSPEATGVVLTNTVEFWEKQDKARARLASGRASK